MQNSSNNSSELDYIACINNLSDQIAKYFTIASSAIGIPGNLISMVIFIRLGIKNPKINMGFLYTLQTFIDLIILILTLLVFRGSPYLYGYLVMNISDSFCRGFTFLRRYLIQVSSWMSVLIIFDRFVFSFYQNRFKFMKNKLILSAFIFGVMILLAIANIGNLFFYIDGTSSKTAILFTCISTYVVKISSDIINMLLRVYIPLILMIIFDSLMIYRLFKLSRSSQVVHQNSLMRKEHQFTIAAISCDVYFFFCYFPLSFFQLLYYVNTYSGVFANNLTLSTLYAFYLNFCINLAFIFQTCSIFMYFGFNKLFRKDLIEIISCILSCKNSRRLNVETYD